MIHLCKFDGICTAVIPNDCKNNGICIAVMPNDCKINGISIALMLNPCKFSGICTDVMPNDCKNNGIRIARMPHDWKINDICLALMLNPCICNAIALSACWLGGGGWQGAHAWGRGSEGTFQPKLNRCGSRHQPRKVLRKVRARFRGPRAGKEALWTKSLLQALPGC